jgi:hypothetical protein
MHGRSMPPTPDSSYGEYTYRVLDRLANFKITILTVQRMSRPYVVHVSSRLWGDCD